MDASLVQKKANFGNSTTPSVTLDASPIQNNLLVVWIYCSNATTITMPGGWNALTSVATGSGSNARAGRMFWKIAGAGESATISGTSGNAGWVIEVIEYSGVNTSSTLNTENNQATTGTSHSTPTVTPSARKCLVVCGFGNRSTGAWSNEVIRGVSATEQLDQAGSNTQSGAMADRLSETFNGTQTVAGSADVSSSGNGSAAIAVFNIPANRRRNFPTWV